MAKTHDTWTVLHHAEIEKLTENLWRVQGTIDKPPIDRVMVVARLDHGGLVIHNPIALDDASMSAIDAWGKVSFIVVPNGFHRMDAKPFAARYPSAKVLCPRGAKKKVDEVVRVSGDYTSFPTDSRVRLEHLDGVAEAEGVMVVESNDGVSLVLNDIVFNMPHKAGFAGFILKSVLQSSGGPRVSRIGKWFLVKDKAALKACFTRLASTPKLRRILVAHHETIDHAPSETLKRVAADL
jgi:hypothetical protein